LQKSSFSKIFLILLIIFNFSLIASYTLLTNNFISDYSNDQIQNPTKIVNKDKIIEEYLKVLEGHKLDILKNISTNNIYDYTSYLSGDIYDRPAGTQKEKDTADWIKSNLVLWGYDTEIQSFKLPDGRESQNVIADKVSNNNNIIIIIIGAHYDTVSQTGGAMDNSIGVAVTLEIARIIYSHEIPLNIKFILFGAEECFTSTCSSYHLGSRYYVSTLPQEEKENITGMINLDVIGEDTDIEFHIKYGLSDNFNEALKTSFSEQNIQVVTKPSQNWSDHRSFENANIPAVFIFTSGYSLGHSKDDTIDKVHFEVTEKITKGIVWYILNWKE